MSEFPHVFFPERVTDSYNSPYGPGKQPVVNPPGEQTTLNIQNRQGHGVHLKSVSDSLEIAWRKRTLERDEQNLPPLPEAYSLFLQVDPNLFNPDSLESYGIEVIAEEENGLLIGSASDINLSELRKKIEKFLAIEGKFKNSAAQLWSIDTGTQWRPQQILSETLQARWGNIADDELLVVEVGISCQIKMPESPVRNDHESDGHYDIRQLKYEQKRDLKLLERDDKMIKREDELIKLIHPYGGKIIEQYDDLSDSFSVKMELSGKGLKDFVLNFPYVFDVCECEQFGLHSPNNVATVSPFSAEFAAPKEEAPTICIIDSGIQEKHRLIAPAILTGSAKSYIGNPDDSADYVAGGHGTRVAGATLFPKEIPSDGLHQLKYWIQNARILDKDCKVPDAIYAPAVMGEIVRDCVSISNMKLYNLSVNSVSPCALTHMSTWGAAIDKIMFDSDALFIVSSGNISKKGSETNPGILDHFQSGRDYPQYLNNASARVASPGNSMFAITVGSLCISSFEDDSSISIGKEDYPSSFTRVGPGMWGSIKPDVVEYGGDFVRRKDSISSVFQLRIIKETSPELVRSTINGGAPFDRDLVGTSFAAPKAAHILAAIQETLPHGSSNLYRALLAQSARWPEIYRNAQSPAGVLNKIGYGVPNLERATSNSEHRITIVNSGTLSAKQADVYNIEIPEQLNRPGDEYSILIEVSVAFTANPRRTRRGTRSYLSTWLDWKSSYLAENKEQFKHRVLNLDHVEAEERPQPDAYKERIPWVIGERSNSGIKGVRLNDSTLQKDWAVIESHQLNQSFAIGVVGHPGWERDANHKVPYSIVVSFEILGKDIPIYNLIREHNNIEIPIEQQVEIQS
jgi:hypothetical protein